MQIMTYTVKHTSVLPDHTSQVIYPIIIITGLTPHKDCLYDFEKLEN